ncbi:MAG: GTP cyclohydrolase I FolE2 [Candidatus Eremiobacteraeota bacterium]|nr:GTP cyclohydrolase I FolE2 [Candidatus Eremiobacteraeota bacterium]
MAHRVAIGIGSNVGDRQGNVTAALQQLRRFIQIERISSAYETKPVGFADQPDFLNLACTGTTDISAQDLHRALQAVEKRIGRRTTQRLGPRAIDLDLLLYDDTRIDQPDLVVPHHGLASRPFVLIPLAEIAPALRHPVEGRTIGELAAGAESSGVRRKAGGLVARIQRDVQESRPQVPLALQRAGVTGVKTVIAVAAGGRQRSTIAAFDVFADLDASRSGVHMSRFSQDIEDVLVDIGCDEAIGVDALALAVARKVVESQKAERAEVSVRAEIALPRHTPASALPTQEFYTVVARSAVTAERERRLLGIEALGITACPCAQQMVAENARGRLADEGFSELQIDRILTTIPVATHNQRSLGTLLVGTDRQPDIETMIEIVEQSMSSETYDLLKRPDELFVVNKAHHAPRFVEDAVREMLRYANDALADYPDETFVFARQTNYESIHKHDAIAESWATLGELRRELRGELAVPHTTLEQWLYAQEPSRE